MQALGSLLLFLFAMVILDKRMGMALEGVPLAATVGAMLAVLTSAFDLWPGASGFNPARDLGPRAFLAIAGWGAVPFGFPPTATGAVDGDDGGDDDGEQAGLVAGFGGADGGGARSRRHLQRRPRPQLQPQPRSQALR